MLTWSSDQILGLERVYELRDTFDIASVNMSIGGDRYYDQTTCDAANSSRKAAIDNLRGAGIATIIASGNDGYIDSIGSPGCISSAISVGSTWDSAGWTNNCDGHTGGTTAVDDVACYSNSASFLDLLAPGSYIESSVPGGGYESWHGTSMAAPHVAGCWAILKEQLPGASVAEIETALKNSGTPVTDWRNSIVVPRINCDLALVVSDRTLSVNVTGLGTVNSTPAGIAGCSESAGTCSALFPDGTAVELTAVLDPEWTSGSWMWSGACQGGGECNILMNSDQTADVSFHCELITIAEGVSITDPGHEWNCANLEAVDGFEVQGPNGSALFRASSSIKLGPGFNVKTGGGFQAIIQ